MAKKRSFLSSYGSSYDDEGSASNSNHLIYAHAHDHEHNTNVLEPASAPAPTLTVNALIVGFGTATIDGVLSPGEWDDAGTITFDVNVLGGGTIPGTLYIMNDDVNLYLAVEIGASVSGDFTGNAATFVFDSDQSGDLSQWDDVLLMNEAIGFYDMFYNSDPNIYPYIGPLFDTALGGTEDGTAAFDNSTAETIYEFSHPLNSNDDAHDLSLGPGDTIGLNLFVHLSVDQYPFWIAEAYFPGPDQNSFATYTIAAPFTEQTLKGTRHAEVFTDSPGFATTYWGRNGNDTIYGMDGSDELHGGNGDDSLDGGSEDDQLFGDRGDDSLDGGSEDDQLFGDRGDDTLFGGTGIDLLTGGRGNDIFAFTAAAQSTPVGGDTITDFKHRSDRIDLTGIDPGVLSFGAAATMTVAAHTVNWYESGGNTIVQADVNGDATADFQITLLGTGLGLTTTDFML